jgi:hypothetical protein
MKTTEHIFDHTIERLSDSNLADVEKLHAAVYGITTARNFFLMKYDTAFTGVRYIGFITYDESHTPIAFYAVIPCYLRFKDKIVLSAQSADTMTHPNYRHKGLFVELAQLTYKLCQSAGIHLIFGFPNQNSLPGFINKLGWQITGTMDCFIIQSTAFPWRKVFSKLPVLRDKFEAYQQGVLKKYVVNQQGLANSVLDDDFAGVYRDHHYRKYKTYTDAGVIKIGNSTLWIKVNQVLLIGDIALMPGEFAGLMYSLKKLASALGIKELHFHTSTGTTLHALFAKDYKPRPSFPIIFKDLGESVQFDKIKFTSADIDTF